MNRVRIGHIGTLHDHSPGMLDSVKKFPDIFEIIGYVPENEERYSEIKDHPSYRDVPVMTEEQLFNAGVDAVMVEGYELELVSTAQRCIDRNVHVHIDKPAGTDIKAFENLLKNAKKRGLTVQMSYMYRYNPSVRECYRRFKSGQLGEVYEVDAIMNTCHPPEKRQWMKDFPGGIMFFLGCHMVDLVYMFQGIPNNIVTFNKCTGFDGVTAIDHSCAVFEYDKGVSTVRATSTEINGFGRRQLVVCGSKATYEIEPIEKPSKTFYTDNTYAATFADMKRELKFEDVAAQGRRYDAMMLEFARCVRGEMVNPYSYEYELQMHKLMLAACGMDIDYKEKTVL